MTDILTVTEAKGLSALVERLHDRWFDADAIVFDRPTESVSIPFKRDQLRLIIYGAEGLHMHDAEQVGEYDLNRIEYDASARCVRISTGLPLSLDIPVRDLHLSLTVA